MAFKPDKGNLVILIAAGFCYLDNNKTKRKPNILNKNLAITMTTVYLIYELGTG